MDLFSRCRAGNPERSEELRVEDVLPRAIFQAIIPAAGCMRMMRQVGQSTIRENSYECEISDAMEDSAAGGAPAFIIDEAGNVRDVGWEEFSELWKE